MLQGKASEVGDPRGVTKAKPSSPWHCGDYRLSGKEASRALGEAVRTQVDRFTPRRLQFKS